MIIDTHAHYDDEQYDDEQYDVDRDKLLMSMESHNVERMVTVGANIESSKAALALTKQYPFIYGAVGVHPNEVAELDADKMKWLRQAAADEKIVAIGEIGLDYYYDQPDPAVQKKWFERQLDLAREVSLPVIIHSREAAEDTMTIMKARKAEEIGGVIHCYSYSVEMAREYVKMGFYIGIGGVVTFKNAKKVKEVVKSIPMEHIVLETDCPYLAPEPHRGSRNDSSNLRFVVQEIAALRGLTEEKVIEQTRENACKLYRKM